MEHQMVDKENYFIKCGLKTVSKAKILENLIVFYNHYSGFS